ncbi:hypothetical protein J5N97_019262 [Dioscorea zingiberensis]|uniref:isochorismate synthase n=1 Tax=Dioscorea zingiberensis TaxID=325984 RepID=A0A9D5CEL5_9LILI|nr:hypothetical protein J5N97_019262 [Dioscorea zingiberensis]
MARAASPDSIVARLLHPTSSSRLTRYVYRPCSLSMNGCNAAPERALGMCETRTLPAVSAPETALSELQTAVFSLKAEPPPRSPSGIIRLEVPVRQRANAVDWLQAQSHLPRCYFSGRERRMDLGFSPVNGGGIWANSGRDLVGVAGVGSAVFFQRVDPFSLQDWRCIRRFLSKDCPLIRAYGAIRFDARTNFSSEWKDFGSFYFTVPQVELDELEESSILATTIAWDDTLLWTWENAVDGLQATMHQISPYFHKSTKEVPQTTIISWNHVPTKASWNTSVNKALQIINSRSSELVKVVLARCSTYVTDTCIDPVTLLACLQVEGRNAYQFYIQPPDAPAFIGNTPEQLFHRKYLNISSEALAGTRARSLNKDEDLQIGRELLFSPKDHIEFTIVRESITSKLENICEEVLVEPSKALRKLPRVQHLCAQLSGRLRSEDDEFAILASLHPTPAVCGLPTEEARLFIENNDLFDRGMYAGPVGWFGGRESEFAVGIRSALVGKGFSTLIYAGVGIVEGSNPFSEWEELDLKASQFTKLLQQWEYQACCQEMNIGQKRVPPKYEFFQPNTDWNVELCKYTLKVYLPGFKKEEFKVQIDHKGKITVKGKRELGENKFMLLEQNFNVPKDSDHDKINGMFEDGCLTLHIPRKVSQDQKTTPSSHQTLIPSDDHEKKASDQKGHEDGVDDQKKKVMKEKVKSSENDESSKCCWLENGSVMDCLLERMNNNRKVIAVAFVAFSVGFYVSQKLKSAGN